MTVQSQQFFEVEDVDESDPQEDEKSNCCVRFFIRPV